MEENYLILYFYIGHQINRSINQLVAFSDNFEINIDSVAPKNNFSILGDLTVTIEIGKIVMKRIMNVLNFGLNNQFCLQQLIHELTHILGNSYSCIDLTFTSEPKLAMESRVHPSLYPNCHHQI